MTNLEFIRSLSAKKLAEFLILLQSCENLDKECRCSECLFASMGDATYMGWDTPDVSCRCQNDVTAWLLKEHREENKDDE